MQTMVEKWDREARILIQEIQRLRGLGYLPIDNEDSRRDCERLNKYEIYTKWRRVLYLYDQIAMRNPTLASGLAYKGWVGALCVEFAEHLMRADSFSRKEVRKLANRAVELLSESVDQGATESVPFLERARELLVQTRRGGDKPPSAGEP